MPRLPARFRDHTHNIFKRLRMQVTAYWTTEPEAGKTLICVIKHNSEDAAEQKW
jgi:hypothetical protein